VVAVWEAVLGALVTFAVAVAALWQRWGQLKSKLRAVRELVDELDEALRDDRVTEEEWRRLWEKLKALVEG